MYSKKLEHLQKTFEEKGLFSGIVIGRQSEYARMGSPCLIKMNISKDLPPSLMKEMDEIIEKGPMVEINKDMSTKTNGVSVIFLFSMMNDINVYYMSPMRANRVHYIQKPPIIYDTFSTTELEKLEDYKKYPKAFPSAVAEQLKTNRFINYTFRNIMRSTTPQMIKELENIIEMFSKEYPNKVACYHHNGIDNNRVLLDTVSLSFYSLIDMIPIFDYKRTEGVGIEILLTNSEIDSHNIHREGRSSVSRLLFAKYRENIFSIDGANLNANYFPVKDMMDYIFNSIKVHSPNDKIFRENKREKEEGKCVE